jgi:hypothetical protein
MHPMLPAEPGGNAWATPTQGLDPVVEVSHADQEPLERHDSRRTGLVGG